MAAFASRSASETIELGRRIGSRLRPGSVIALQGPLGAGKTTLAKGIAQALEVREPVTSPTFTLISEYRGAVGGEPAPLIHVDLYRLNHAEELEDLGLEEILAGPWTGDAGGAEGQPGRAAPIVMVEWSEKAATLLPEDSVRLVIALEPDGTRTLEITGIEL